MAGHKYQDKRTKLPQSLLEQISSKDSDLASGAPSTSRRGGRPLDRKSARKEKREAAKDRKSQFFTKHKDHAPLSQAGPSPKPASLGTKRPATATVSGSAGAPEARPAKKPKLANDAPPSTSSPKTKPPMKPKPKPTALERLVSSTSKPKKKREKDIEDDEIAWLEAKLGITKKKGKGKAKDVYGGAFSADGLNDILLDLDRLEEDKFGDLEGSEDGDLDLDGLEDELEGDDDEESEDDDEGESAEESEVSDEDEEEVAASSEDRSEAASAQEESEDDSASEDEEQDALEGSPPEDIKKDDQPASGKPTGAYVPPHLRQKTQSSEAGVTQTPEQIKLARQLKGLLNRLSEQNIEAIVTEVEALYRSNPRNDVTQALTSILLNSVSSSANLLDTFVILHAAFVAAIHKIIGIEFAAYFVEQTVSSYETHWKTLGSNASGSLENQSAEGDAPTGTKESSNLLVLLSELYNFQVISCVLIYDLIRALLNSEFSEQDVELLLKVVKNSGQQMRQDDPLALKDIIQLVQDKMRGKNANQLSSRFRFMVETLVNLKNNKLKDAKRSTGTGQNVAAEAIDRMKKYLSGINKKRHVMSHEPLRVSLEDLHSSSKRGKWWLVGAAWGGNPLVENQAAKAQSKSKDAGIKSKGSSAAQATEQLMQLARQHGMNTEVRRNIFVVLVSSDDYVDACERLTQLDLQETQQREIMRVVLHCCGNERTYNPFYTLVANHLCQKSHSHRITLQYCLWDFLRSLGESQVGGEAISREFVDSGTDNVSDSTINNYAKAYAWWLARGSVALTILKPVEFLDLQPQSKQFFKTLFLQMIISSQSNSPLVDVQSAESAIPQTRNRAAIEEIVSKALRLPTMCKSIAYFIQSLLSEGEFRAKTKRARELLVWGLGATKEALQRGDVPSDDDL